MLEYTVDKSGFPSVYIPEMKLEVSWLPFTKIQLEHFIADTNNPSFDPQWYAEMAKRNPRITPWQMEVGKYEGVFVTDILPSEIKLVAQWMGPGYNLPTVAQWVDIFNCLYRKPAQAEVIEEVCSLQGLNERARILVEMLDNLTKREQYQLLGDDRHVCDQMLMRLGVMEYVYVNTYRNSYAGQGQPNRHFHPHTRSLPGEGPETLTDQLRGQGARIRRYGFRLIKRR